MVLGPRKQRRELSLLQLLPNFLTVGAICAGLTAIRFATVGRFDLSVALIVLAAVLDGLDGRLARLLKSVSEIGAELDSLADFLNFGIAPALTIYFWALQDSRSIGWIAVLVYAVCCVMRLARFNVGNRAEAEDKPKVGGFVGVPSPAGALVVLLPLFYDRLFGGAIVVPNALVIFWLVFSGLLMISRLPTPSLKSARIYAEYVKFVVLGFVALVAALMTYPWATLVGVDLAYLACLIWVWWVHRRRQDKEG